MSDPNELPATLEGCHSLIRTLQSRLQEKTRLIKSLMGYDPTDTATMTAYMNWFSEASSKVDHAAVEAEIAAEEAMRLAQKRERARKKKAPGPSARR